MTGTTFERLIAPVDTERWVGAGITRIEDERLLRAQGRFVDDIDPHGLLHMAVGRCPYPHARIGEIDAGRALELDGVVGVMVGSQVRARTQMCIRDRACMGLERLSAGTIEVYGERVPHPTPETMLRRGVCYLPGDRINEGLVMPRSIRENASLGALDLPGLCRMGVLRSRSELREVRDVVRKLQINAPSVNRPVGVLSGGNQQKVVFARALLREMRVVLIEEPTSGIDVGSRAEVYRLIRDLCEAGAAIVLISSDLPEILHLARRAYIVHRGAVRAELAGSELTEVSVVAHFFEVEQPTGASRGRG